MVAHRFPLAQKPARAPSALRLPLPASHRHRFSLPPRRPCGAHPCGFLPDLPMPCPSPLSGQVSLKEVPISSAQLTRHRPQTRNQNDSALAQGHLTLRWELFSAAQHRSRRQVTSANVPKPCRHGRSETKRLTPRSTRGSGKLEDRAMFTRGDVEKRNGFAACAAFRIEGLEASLDHAREIAVRDELGAVGHYIEEAQGYLAQIRLLHLEALDEFRRGQGE